HTRTNLLAVQQHRASATLRQAAPEARTMQVELVVQDVQERRIEARGHAVHETVDLDLQLARHTTLHFLGRKARRGEGTTTDTSPTAAHRRYERRWSVAIVAARTLGNLEESTRVLEESASVRSFRGTYACSGDRRGALRA